MVKFEQIMQNLENIGNPDPNIREQVFTFWHVKREQNKFSQDQYEYLLKRSIDNIQNKQQVLVRSYSLLLLDCLLQADSSYNLFDENDYQIITSNLIEYMTLETDFRGYDPKLGFIHTLSHLSDCIYTLNYNNKVNIDQLLKTYLYLIDNANCKYLHLEDERIARVLANINPQYRLLIGTWLSTRNSYLSVKNPDRSTYLLQVSKYRLIYKALQSYQTYNSILSNQLNTFY